jgi:hypothetical protein
MIRTIIALGYGDDVDLVLEKRLLIPANASLSRVNVLAIRASDEPHKLPLINPIGLGKATAAYREEGILNIVTVGSLKPRSPYARRWLREGGSGLELASALTHAFGTDSSDKLRSYVQRRFGDGFEFPPLRQVLPFLFASDDVAVGDNREDLRNRALQDPSSYRKDAKVNIDGVTVKVLRAPRQSTHLINRRLFIKKFKDIHCKEGISCVFFDKNRTVVVGLEEMKRYATENELTFQSFIDPI